MKRFFFLAVLLALLLTGCVLPGMPTPTPTLPALPPASTKGGVLNTLPALSTATKSGQPSVITATSLATLPPPTATSSGAGSPTKAGATLAATKPAATAQAATATKPAATQAPATKAPTQAPTSAPSNSKDVKIFMIATGDNGASGTKIGCGDSLVGVVVNVPDPQAPLRGALDILLANHSQFYGQSGLYNALFRSDLKVKSVTINNAVADIRLTGAMTLGGECDNPRVQAQLEQVALQFSTVKSVNIYINDKNLKDLLSLK
jgi:hypothetical protein